MFIPAPHGLMMIGNVLLHPHRRGLTRLIAMSLAVCLVSCQNLAHPPQVTHTEPGGTADPVIFIPGMLGSRLVDDRSGRVVWGIFGSHAIGHNTAAGRRKLALPMQPGATLETLDDGIRPDGAVGRLMLRPWLGMDAYESLFKTLEVPGYRRGKPRQSQPPGPCFEFAYDWRRTYLENVRSLADFIDETRTMLEAESLRRHGVRREVKFSLVAHSRGGLLARYYLMHGRAGPRADGAPPPVTWAGARHVRRLVQVGTPNSGSATALLDMANGASLFPIPVRIESAVIGTMPAVYELLPGGDQAKVVDATGNPLDLFDPRTWLRYGWGLADPAQDDCLADLLPEVNDPLERRRIALDHLDKSLRSAKTFHTALHRPYPPPPGLEMHAFIGAARSSVHRVAVDANGGLNVVSSLHGDGIVTAHSALWHRPDGSPGPIRWSSNRTFNASHIGLPVHRNLIDQLLPLLQGAP